MLYDNRAIYFKGYRRQERLSAKFFFKGGAIGLGLLILSAGLTIAIVSFGSACDSRIFELYEGGVPIR
jgi:hypothetical protein